MIGITLALSEFDRSLLQQCLDHHPGSWERFVDRFLGLVLHVVNHSASARSLKLSTEDREDLCSEVFLELLKNDFGVMRAFRGQSSLATYLTVIARRVVVRKLIKCKATNLPLNAVDEANLQKPADTEHVDDAEEMRQLLEGLEPREAEVVKMFHLEGLSYSEISSITGVPENSIGPTLSRAAKSCGARG